MKDLSSHMMDIVQNSIRAEASWIQIRICEDPEADLFLIEIQDNGCGMGQGSFFYQPDSTQSGPGNSLAPAKCRTNRRKS